MYAVMQSGGKQYQVSPGVVVKLERLPGEPGASVTLDQVMLYSDGEQVEIGQPLIDGMSVRGRIVEQGRHRKIIVFKHKRRKDFRKKQGHRQYFTAVLVESIEKAGTTASES